MVEDNWIDGLKMTVARAVILHYSSAVETSKFFRGAGLMPARAPSGDTSRLGIRNNQNDESF
jgi:hypothetical protein